MGQFEQTRIDYLRVFQCIPEIMGMPFVLKGKRWYAARHIDGAFSTRFDKLTVRMVDDGIQVFEQGGEYLTLFAWMQKYGGCGSARDAKEKLLSIIPGKILVSDAIETEMPAKFVPKAYFERSYENRLKNKDNLTLAMYRLFGVNTAEYVLKMYGVGTERTRVKSESGQFEDSLLTTYWYIDKDRNVLHDKLLLYEPNGHRNHAYGGGRRHRKAQGYSNRGLFGAHLLPARKEGERVYVVESEKAALFCKAYYGQGIWLGSGGKQNLKKAWVDPDWVVLADIDAWAEWSSLLPDQCPRWWELYDGYTPGPTDDMADVIEWKILNKNKDAQNNQK